MADIIEFRYIQRDKKIRAGEGEVIFLDRKVRREKGVPLWRKLSPKYIADRIDSKGDRKNRIARLIAGLYVAVGAASAGYAGIGAYMYDQGVKFSSSGIEEKVEAYFCKDAGSEKEIKGVLYKRVEVDLDYSKSGVIKLDPEFNGEVCHINGKTFLQLSK